MLHKLPALLAGLALALPNDSVAGNAGTKSETAPKTQTEEEKAPGETWESAKRQAALRVQLFLDKQGFGPGKIDGRWGGFTQKAAERWNESGKDLTIGIGEDGELDLAKAGEIPVDGGMTTAYVVTDEDRSRLGTLPDEPEDMAELTELPYTSLMELVCEKFHADPDFVREINGLEKDADLEVGSPVKVPNVAEPFDLSKPMEFSKAAEEAKDDKSDNSAKTTGDKPVEPDPDMELTVLRAQRVVEVREGGQLIHSFPISPGANDNSSPPGEWKVSVISWMPEFRWDKSMLEDGERSDEAYLLPPGPNNPVGIVWIGISADGIGLHGTPYPDAVGRNRSHGCIRLSNWDAMKLATTVSIGTKVLVK